MSELLVVSVSFELTISTFFFSNALPTLITRLHVLSVDSMSRLNIISVVMKSGIFRGPHRKKVYRSYKNFDLEHFNIALKSELEKLNDSAYNEFETDFCGVLKKHAPIKVKMLRHNDNSFMTKNLRKAIMHISKFKNCFNKCSTYENWCSYKTQRNYCVNQISKSSSVLTNEKEIANTMINYFINITKHLNLKPHTASNKMDIEQLTSAFNNHVSIKKIREVSPEINSNNFEFTKVTEQSVKNEVLKLNTKKSSTSGSIPATISKQPVETYLPFLTKAINLSITECEFPDKLKKPAVIPLYKKQDPLKKENYCPISLLLHVSKVLYAQIFSCIVFIISTVIIGIFYCLNYTSLLLHLITTHLVIDFIITM